MASPSSFKSSGGQVSLRLEPVFRTALDDVARRQGTDPASIIAAAEAAGNGNRSSAVRCYVLGYFVDRVAAYEGRAS